MHSPGVPSCPHLTRSPAQLFSELCRLEIAMGPSSRSHNQLLTPSAAPCPSLEAGGGAENAQLLILAGSFWWPAPTRDTSPHPCPIWGPPDTSHLINIPKDTLITLEIPRVLEVLTSGPRVTDLAPLSLGKLQRFEELWDRSRDKGKSISYSITARREVCPQPFPLCLGNGHTGSRCPEVPRHTQPIL